MARPTRTTLAILIALVTLAAPPRSRAQVHYHDSGMPWKNKAARGADAEAGGWYYNLGITGMRAMLIKERPEHLRVTYVYADTPAHGLVQPGDIITGVNGDAFTVPHRNGYSTEVFGGHGPMTDFARALDRSQGDRLKGLFVLDLERNQAPLRVTMDVGTRYGAFAPAFPMDCPKVDLILEELYPYIAGEQGDDGSWGAPQQNTFAALALLASGDETYLPVVRRNVEMHARTTKAVDDSWLINWRYMAAAIVMGEYYLATGEEWLIDEMQEVYDFLTTTQYTDVAQIAESARERNPPKDNRRAHGGWGHNPGYEGYGPIAMLTAQGALALAIMHRCGIEVDRDLHVKAYDFLTRGTGTNGYVWYADVPGEPDGWADMGRTGAAALANALSPYPEERYHAQALRHARIIGKHPETFPDTHGSPIMGMGYTALGAFSDPESYKRMMDNNRWWFTLAHCPDGTFYYQPNRDYNASDFTSGASRISASSAVALIFSLKNRNIYVTGAYRQDSSGHE